ncbi:MAG: phenylalanine--tRNA ligase subunit alpha, partial [Nitrososphaera sp.]
LKNGDSLTLQGLAEKTNLEIDQVRRGVEWLKFKNFASIEESSSSFIALAPRGNGAVKMGLPERRLVEAIKKGNTTVAEILASGLVNRDETNAAIAAAKRNGWIRFIEGARLSLTGSSHMSSEEVLLHKLGKGRIEASKLSDEEKRALDNLKKRPDYVTQTEVKDTRISITDIGKSLNSGDEERLAGKLTSDMITSGRWTEVKLGALDVEAPAPVVFSGRVHPLVSVIDEVKEIFVGLGFEEIDGPILQSSFWNFDALFIPQEHSAREMQDTFYVSGQTQEIPASEGQKRKVARVHRKGWGSWNAEEAGRVVLRTHTTPVTLGVLAANKVREGRFFSVGRVFRNEKPSYKHLVEFHQVEGVATAPGLSLRDLMGLQKEFYAKMGIKKVKFWPTYFPYTEPSLQSMVYNETLQKWVELFGMGIFRPEVTHPLGIKNPVLAWGGGVERIAMLRFGVDDVRELYSSRLGWLRSVPRCQL